MGCGTYSSSGARVRGGTFNCIKFQYFEQRLSIYVDVTKNRISPLPFGTHPSAMAHFALEWKRGGKGDWWWWVVGEEVGVDASRAPL